MDESFNGEFCSPGTCGQLVHDVPDFAATGTGAVVTLALIALILIIVGMVVLAVAGRKR